jgi:hypothetical protein
MARIVTSTYRYKRPPRKRKAATLVVPEMTARPVPARHWRCYGDAPLPTGREALDEPFAAFPSWFMRITCDRCGKDRMLNEAHMLAGNMTIRAIIAKMHHDGCGGRAGRVELGSVRWVAGGSVRSMRTGDRRGIIPSPWRQFQLIVGDGRVGMTGIRAVKPGVPAQPVAAICRDCANTVAHLT